MHDGPPLAFLLLLGSWIPILALKSLIKEFRGKDGGTKRASSSEIEQLKAQVAALNEQVEQLRHTATGFDLSFDKRLSEIELQARFSKLSDVSTESGHQQLQRGGHP
ncbi:MAG: hypothetical protein RL169_2188 [Armatimonadota bacterium]|jgi:predicted nuclease with TOPRIM domain